MVYKAMDIARLLIWQTNTEQGDLITNLKLQKLLFYQQGFWLAEYGEPLFAERVEAWTYGPVVPTVYDRFKGYGRAALDVQKEGREMHFAPAERERFFYSVYEVFVQYSASGLVRLSHEEPAWQTAWAKGHGTEITHEAMRKNFLGRIDD